MTKKAIFYIFIVVSSKHLIHEICFKSIVKKLSVDEYPLSVGISILKVA